MITLFQWNLVCSRTHYANIQQSILMFGVLLGNIIFGNIADRYIYYRFFFHESNFVSCQIWKIEIYYSLNLSFKFRYGRKMPLMIAVVLQLVSGIGCAVVPWFPALLLMKLLSALATGGTMVTSYVICK